MSVARLISLISAPHLTAGELVSTLHCICPGRSAHNTTITTMEAADSKPTSEQNYSDNETEDGEAPPLPSPKKKKVTTGLSGRKIIHG